MLFEIGAALLAIIAAFLILIICALLKRSKPKKGSVQIVVLGDIGRSPRMQYHALSILQHGGSVDFVGYLESAPVTELRAHQNVRFFPLAKPPALLQAESKLIFGLIAPLKVLFQTWDLWTILAYRKSSPEWLLVQNPPSIPTLLLAIVASKLRGSKLVIDWHNFGYSILALKLGENHRLVKISKAYEQFLGKFAYANFAVTDAICEVLKTDFAVTKPLLALHDRPAPLFVPLTTSQRTAFLTNNVLTVEEASDIISGRTRLIVSSTSWTADEDFSMLLDALRDYSASATSDSPHLPELLVIITGKGPQKEQYEDQIERLTAKQELEMVTITTAWLSFEDYATLLGAADLGVSLHTSSSGVDLPMKVVDMFGAGLPVLGYSNFKAWSELVQEDVNGKGFTTASQMSDTLKSLMNPTSEQLKTLKQGAMQESRRRWSSEWDPVAGRLFGLC